MYYLCMEGKAPLWVLVPVLRRAAFTSYFIRREHMKKVLSIALALLLVLGLTAIAKPASADA